eukprot:gb/GEZN01010281.1/.p1 GENE.gb/GEZN01010281.1/~~gb/GEZN01010281.1/.p1  ORF type:complete len:345 (+),score=31.98 gb/GEZN01010281.1/:187-1221(+)
MLDLLRLPERDGRAGGKGLQTLFRRQNSGGEWQGVQRHVKLQGHAIQGWLCLLGGMLAGGQNIRELEGKKYGLQREGFNADPAGKVIKVLVGLEVSIASAVGFSLLNKLTGPGLRNLMHIMSQAPGVQISVHGRGSHADGRVGTGPLHLRISGKDEEACKLAKSFADNLILTVQNEFHQHKEAYYASHAAASASTSTPSQALQSSFYPSVPSPVTSTSTASSDNYDPFAEELGNLDSTVTSESESSSSQPEAVTSESSSLQPQAPAVEDSSELMPPGLDVPTASDSNGHSQARSYATDGQPSSKRMKLENGSELSVSQPERTQTASPAAKPEKYDPFAGDSDSD